MKKPGIEESNKLEIFAYLTALRERGDINMFKSTPYVQEEFALNRYEARKLILEWMNSQK